MKFASSVYKRYEENDMIYGKLFRDMMKTLQLYSLCEKDSSRFRLFRARDLNGH